MCDLKPGDVVVCVSNSATDEMRLPIGATYTIVAVQPPFEPLEDRGFIVEWGVQLNEIGWIDNEWQWGFCASSFRKVIRRDLTAWLETAATDTDRWDKPIKAPAPLHPAPSVDALFRRIMAGGDR